ncbi:hypothetical protein [Pseudalkalibacillus decolorationis]|uniref:hypothetical protein n=1 Tax=Pseudalkalibacillus decolorationis TaxID=163879 RepID=UPI002147FDB1|nr:hypothetical protein [Pseudalkalibacillus decolorationis]
MLDIHWMMNRRDSRWWEGNSWEIYNKLRDDMYATIDFLKTCSAQHERRSWKLAKAHFLLLK